MSNSLYGVLASFASPEAFIAGLRRARESGFTRVEANVPYPVEGMDAWLPGKPTPIARAVLGGGIVGAAGGYFMQWYATRDYALDVGGRPIHSWPAFIPVTFELTVLTGVLVGIGALLWLCGLPRLDHPCFAARDFARATQDRFFLCIRTSDPRFDLPAVHDLFRRCGAELIEEVRS